MLQLLRIEKRKARKEHRCNWCLQNIIKGEFYEVSAQADDGTVFTWKNHLACREIAKQLNMWDDCDYGLGQDDFAENIFNEYQNITGFSNETIWKTPFVNRLNFVLDYHNIEYSLTTTELAVAAREYVELDFNNANL